jgi:hypothetical protein
MDDGTQTLGIMEVLDGKSGNIMYSLATVELPYIGNQPKISCIPMDTYRVVSHNTGKYGKCFWLISNEGGDYTDNQIAGNGYIRGSILIHPASKATSNLQGCIGPGLKFNAQTNQMGNQKGTGMFYLSPSKEQSKQAMNKLLNTLYNVGSFKMEIVSGFILGEKLKDIYPPLPSSFNIPVQQLARERYLLPNPYIASK